MSNKLKKLMNKITKAGLLHFVRNDKIRKKVAFTLAEVLITLGIIGVVAALTIPNLLSKLNKNQVEVAYKNNYAIIQQAFKMSQKDFSYYSIPPQYSVQGILSWFNTYMKPYLKVQNICLESPGCWHKKGVVKDLNGDSLKYETDNGVGRAIVAFTLTNGAYYILDVYINPIDIGHPKVDEYTLIMMVDVNGAKKPNIYGKDIYSFYFDPVQGFLPIGYGQSASDIDENCLNDNGYLCPQKVVSEHWKINDKVWKR